MPDYRRAYVEHGTYFFCVLTYKRKIDLTTPRCRELLHNAWTAVCERHPFQTVALCLLPDHLHCIWTLPEGDSNYSLRWKEIKRLFTKAYLQQIGPGEQRNASRVKHSEAAVWQRRFWEHVIRDEVDLNNHFDYIHYNPAKHGLVSNVSDWPWSSFHRFVKNGWYEPHWGGDIPKAVLDLKCGE